MEPLRFGRYETLRLIAAGGMAKVYVGRARGPAGFERLVAIKVMHDHIAADPDFGHMFLDEARLAAGIRHPKVVPTLDVAEDGRFLVMELVDGASLRDVLLERKKQGQGPLPVDASLRIILDTLEGLHAAHDHCDRDGRALRIVHRDISPHNILVGADGVCRITDFGIARAEARLTTTREGQLKGKMPYMAPEQLRNAGVDRRVDVYAAGCVLWEMLTGERLFSADNEAALACMVLEGPRERLATRNPDVPAPIDAACMQALAPLGERFESARAFGEALEHAAREAGIEVAHPREVGALTEGLRRSLPPPSVQAPEGHATITRAAPEGATTTLDVNDDEELPLAVRPVRVGSSSTPPAPEEQTDSAIQAVAVGEGDATSASLVAPVSRPPASPRPRGAARLLAVGAVGAAVAFAAMWVTLWEGEATAPAEPTANASAPSSEAPAARSEEPDVEVVDATPPEKSLEDVARDAARAASASAAPERPPAPRSVALPRPAWRPPKPPPAAPKPSSAPPGELHPEKL